MPHEMDFNPTGTALTRETSDDNKNNEGTTSNPKKEGKRQANASRPLIVKNPMILCNTPL